MRVVFNELACTQQLVELARLIRGEDIPRAPQRLPRPLTTEQDQLLQRELLCRNDLGGNVFLLIRHTGMRIGECADLSCDCLRSPFFLFILRTPKFVQFPNTREPILSSRLCNSNENTYWVLHSG